MNVRAYSEGTKKRKTDLLPYRTARDTRFKVNIMCIHIISFFIFFNNACQWLKEDLLGYLMDWKKCVEAREGFDPGDQKKMMLSRETTSGIIMTGNLHNIYVCMLVWQDSPWG